MKKKKKKKSLPKGADEDAKACCCGRLAISLGFHKGYRETHDDDGEKDL